MKSWRSIFVSLSASLATSCASPEAGTYARDEIERLCITEGGVRAEPCVVIETGELGEGLRYALYDLRGADAASSADATDSEGLMARNAAAILEETEQRRWRAVWVDTPDDPSEAFYGTPRLTVVEADTLLYAPIGIYGTGSYNEDVLLVRRDGSWLPVDATTWLAEAIERLPPGFQVWKGVSVDPATLTASSDLWRENDANCCPTGGRFDAELVLNGERLVVDVVRYTGDGAAASGDPSRPAGQIRLEDGTTLTVPLYMPTLHATIRDDRGSEWLLLSGVECSQCDAAEQLWLAPLARAQETGALRPYAYPGDLHPMGLEGGDPSYRSRAFVGACLADRAPGLFLVEEQLDSRAPRKGIRVVTPGATVVESALPWTQGAEDALVAAGSSSSCREIEGRLQYVL
jgi:hypothetical protein